MTIVRARSAVLALALVVSGVLLWQTSGLGQGVFDRRGFRAAAPGDLLAPEALDFGDGAATVPDRETFVALAYQGQEVRIDRHLAGWEFVKFVVAGAGTDDARIYFMNTKTHRAHGQFMRVLGGSRRDRGNMMGVLVYRPLLAAPSGQAGLYSFEFQPRDAYPFDMVQVAYELLEDYAPAVRGHLAYHPMPAAVSRYQRERERYEAAGLPVFLDEHLYSDIAYLPLHESEGYGRLRVMSPAERPGERDVVLYRTLPNELPRVAGIITAFRQTPLSHVNLRAVQDDVPNAFIRGAADDPVIADLVDQYVYYRVTASGYELRAAERAEVEAFFAARRPADPQRPLRDLAVSTIRPLAQVSFADAASVGVKAANVAVLQTLGLPEGVVPDGFAIPFYFYDEFMRHNGFYEYVSDLHEAPAWQDSPARAVALAEFREAIENGEMPEWMLVALADLQRRFPEGTAIRLRSSTNNEDLPGFNGAGLYDSYTHRPEEGHLAKSVKQVYASLWNYLAYEEREFHRIDHFAAAMGVLVHPNYSDERANGVAVTDDVVYQSGTQQVGRRYYVNVQVGEDLVTNPEEESVPEEILLSPGSARDDVFVTASNRVPDDETILSAVHRDELRAYLRMIHSGFSGFYDVEGSDQFAIEIEFKITAQGQLAIKQARPWVY